MRAIATLSVLFVALGALTACQSGPVFRGITKVKVQHIGSTQGLTTTPLDSVREKDLIKCLYQTREVTEDQTLRDLLQTTYLLVISDAQGDRNFELYTAQNLKGNKGKYYVNSCVHPLIRDIK